MYKRKIIYILEIVIVVFVVIASAYSFHVSKDSFLNFSLAQALTLLVAIGIAFNASQFMIDERKRKEQLEKIVDKIQRIVSEQSFYSFNENDDVDKVALQITMTCRKLSNCIDVLETFSNRYNLKDDTTYIRSEYMAYKTLVSGKECDLRYLSESRTALKKFAQNIESKCDHVIVELYK